MMFLFPRWDMYPFPGGYHLQPATSPKLPGPPLASPRVKTTTPGDGSQQTFEPPKILVAWMTPCQQMVWLIGGLGAGGLDS